MRERCEPAPVESSGLPSYIFNMVRGVLTRPLQAKGEYYINKNRQKVAASVMTT